MTYRWTDIDGLIQSIAIAATNRMIIRQSELRIIGYTTYCYCQQQQIYNTTQHTGEKTAHNTMIDDVNIL